MMKRTITSIRDEFPILDQQVFGHDLIYFDNAATTQKPRAVIEALSRYYESYNSNVHRGIHALSHKATEAYEAARTRTAAYIGAANENEIVFTRGTTEAINLVASSWCDRFLKPGDRVLLTEMEHHSNLVPWQLAAERNGAELEFVPVTGDEGLLDLERLDELLSGNVKLFAFTHISNSLGTINPVAELCRKARENGVVTLVDAAQAAGHATLDVNAIGCDFLAFSGHKMCGPTGIGVLYGRREVLEAMPPYHGGGEMIRAVDWRRSEWKGIPHKFEAGTPHISGAIALHAAMDYLDGIGRDAIHSHDRELGGYAAERLRGLKNIRLLGPLADRAGIASFNLKDVHAHDVVSFADRRGVALRGGHHCTQPLMKRLGLESSVRASFYLYNTKDEIDRFVDVIDEIRAFFG